MDAIENLDIHLDTSDRKHYYDYVHSAVVSDPKEAIGQVPEDKGVKLGVIFKNDSHELRVSHITDAHFLDKRCLEKFAPQESSDYKPDMGKDDVVFQSDFLQWGYEPVPRYVMPIYQPGEAVRGTVVVKLKKKLEAERLIINLLGRATTNVRIYHRYGYYDVTKHEEFADETCCLWQSPDAPKNDEFTSLVTSGEKAMGEGHHELPFEFKIPNEAPGSVTQMVPKSHDVAYLSYRLKATVDRGKMFGRGNAVTGRGIWVDRPMNVACLSDAMQPVEAEERLNTGMFSSGNITLRARLPRSAYARNEEVPVTIEVDNKSGSVVDNVAARIVLTGRGLTGGKWSPKASFTNKAVGKSDGPVKDGLCQVYKWSLPFDFRECIVDSCMIPTTESADISQILDYHYEVYIKLKRPGLHRKMEMSIPITVGTHNDSPLYPKLEDLSLH